MHDDIRLPVAPVADQQTENKQTFETPEAVAAKESPQREDVFIDLNQLAPDLDHEPAPKRQRKWWPPSKKQWMVYTLVLFLLIGGSALAAANMHAKPKPKPKVVAVKHSIVVPVAKSDLVPSTLSGEMVNPADNQRPITAVMIENLDAARPQSGLSQAGVVFEALTEGGITRFEALYQDQLPTNVGPVRSVRPYFLDWALGFDAPIAHAGGSSDALSEIPTLGIKNLDYLYYPGYYTRINTRPAPHNLYTSIPSLNTLEQTKGWTTSNYQGWPRKADAPAKNPPVTNISFILSSADFNVAYSYDAATNSYNRDEAGQPQVDANTGQQLSPKVVIGMVVPWSQGSLDTSDAYYSVYQDIGSGQAYVFQDGTVSVVQWNKPSAKSPLTFNDAQGNPVKLNAGQTWITVIAATNDVSYN